MFRKSSSTALETERILKKDSFEYHRTLQGKLHSTRYKIALLGFFGFVMLFSMRVIMSIAIVDMVEEHETHDGSFNENCPERQSTNSSQKKAGTFNWTASQQAKLLSAFFYGYALTQFPGGYFASKHNGKNLFGWAFLMRTVLLTLNPLVAYFGGVQLLCCVRALEGAAEGVTWPTFQHLSGRWAPEFERSFFSGFVVSGASIGIMLTFPIVGLFCTVDLLDGWPLAFIFYGVLGVIWFVLWMIIASDSPENHPSITESEKSYIKQSSNVEIEHDVKTPWKEIFTSIPFFALVFGETTQNVVDYGIMTCLPLYLSNVLNFEISQNGFYNSLPWLLSFFATVAISRLTDFLLSEKYVTTAFIRKLNQLLASFGSAIFLVLAGYAGCDAGLAIACITAAMFFYGFRYPGAYCNILDIAPYFAGITYGITNTFGSVAGILAPVIVEKITDANIHSKELWLYSFYFIGATSALGGIVFTIFGSGELQPWGKPKHNDIQLIEKNSSKYSKLQDVL